MLLQSALSKPSDILAGWTFGCVTFNYDYYEAGNLKIERCHSEDDLLLNLSKNNPYVISGILCILSGTLI